MASDKGIAGPRPEITIVIPTYARDELLAACLNSLADQTEPPGCFEVLVVGSADSTKRIVSGLRFAYSLRYLAQASSGAGATRNRGAEAATSPILLFLDDDITADPGLVGEHLRLHRAQERVAGLGRITLKLPSRLDPFARQFARARADHYAELDAGITPSFTDCWSGNLSVRRDAFLALGGFAAELQREEDIELGYRLQSAGVRLVYIPLAVAQENRPLGFDKITADAQLSGAASVVVWRRHPGAIARLKLGAFEGDRVREVLLRRVLLRVGFPLVGLRLLSSALARGPRGWAWYRFVCTYAYWRGALRAIGRGETWDRLTRGTLILMYHAIGTAREPADTYVVPVARFARQLAWLRRRGYPVISLDTLIAHRRQHSLPPAGSIVLTFDDGYRDALTVARPLLARSGFPATVFLVTGLAGARNLWDRATALANRPLISWELFREAAHEGINFSPHSRSHPSLPSLSREAMREEVAGSRDDLHRELHRAPEVFAYPYGHSDRAVHEVVREMGFAAACGTRSGRNYPATDDFDLRRLHVDGRWGLIRFMLALMFGVDVLRR